MLAHIEERRIQTELLLVLARLLTGQDQQIRERLEAQGITDITPAQSRVLMILFQAREPLTAREMARRMGVAEPTMSRFVRALVERGWIERRQRGADRRAWELQVTRYAREHLPQLIAASNSILDRLFGGFSREELRQLHHMSLRIQTNLEPKA